MPRDERTAGTVTAVEFTKRLSALCLSGDGMPRKLRDRQILLMSVALLLETNRDYTEPEINLAIGRWIKDVGAALDLDPVSLRRYLVDAGFLVRDVAGQSYSVAPEGAGIVPFSPDVLEIDPIDVVEEAHRRKEERRRMHGVGKEI